MNNAVAGIRAFLFYFGYIISLIWFSVTAVLFFSFLPYSISSAYIITWNRVLIIWLKITCGLQVKVYGAENLPNQPYVALSKHQSQWETYFLQYYLAPVSIVLKHELLYLPFFGWGLRFTRPIAIDRGSPRQALKQTMEQGVQRLSDGVSVLIFPEGTRVDPGTKGKYARGGTNIAIKAGAPIVPIALNAGDFWPAGTLLKRPGTISVVIGEPIDSRGRESRELTEQVETWIENEMTKLSP